MLLPTLLVLCCTGVAQAAVTVYGQIPLGQTQTVSAGAQSTALAAYDDTLLPPPPVPNPPINQNIALQLQQSAANTPGLSIPHVGASFFGFSIEMSVISQVLGRNSTNLFVPFLNFMSNLADRAGGVVIRLGGNTQEFATWVPEIPDGNGRVFGKEDSGSNQTTKTPAVIYTTDMFYMMSNISALVPVKWFLGIPFNDTNWRLEIVEYGEQIVGSNLLGFQAGNEPDFYQTFGRRVTYAPQDYFNEIGNLLQTIEANPNIPVKNNLIGPSVATGPWTPEMVWDTGFIQTYAPNLYALSVEHYPDNNCALTFNTGQPIVNVTTEFPEYLNHGAPVSLVAPYINSANLANAAGKPFIMFETNTASCGGFEGISDSFASALWALDYGYQMAYANFTHALLHFGGQNVYYNPFTSPPTNQSAFNQWTVGPIYYSTLVLAESFGQTNTSQIVDLNANQGNIYTPAYAIYEKSVLTKVALFNYISDTTGASDVSYAIGVAGGVPSSIRVKYLAADSVSQKQNITWAGQTFGDRYTADGRFKGTLNVTTINCDQTANTCTVRVPAPGFALVFLNTADAVIEVGQATETFATTAYTKLRNTATIDPAVLETSNGEHGAARQLAATSPGGIASSAWGFRFSAAHGLVFVVSVMVIAGMRVVG